jgi:hypothetical protein
MQFKINKEVEFEIELVDAGPELRLVVSNDDDNYIILTISEDGVVEYNAEEVRLVGLADVDD